MPGAGKSSVGKMLSERWGMSFADMDTEIERESGQTIPEIFRDKGEMVFRNMEQSVLRRLSNHFEGIISTGGGTPCFFDNMETMNRTGLTVFIHTPMEVLHDRLQEPSGRPMFDDGETPGKKLAELWEERESFYLRSQLIIIDSDAEKIIRRIERYIQSA